jgi:putative membrane protein
MWNYGPYGYNSGFGFMGGGFMMIVFWIIVIGLIILAVRAFRDGGLSGKQPLDVLKERYAKGEITAEQFEKMKNDLQK